MLIRIDSGVSLGKAEAMLDTKFYVYHNKAANATAIRTMQYSVPPTIHNDIDMIYPTVHFDETRQRLQRVKKRTASPTSHRGYNMTLCSNSITPDCIRGLYDFADFQASPNSRARLGIYGEVIYPWSVPSGMLSQSETPSRMLFTVKNTC